MAKICTKNTYWYVRSDCKFSKKYRKMSNYQLKTPVAFIIFNRPDTTKKVFAEIAKARPPKLLVIADGPRADHSDDVDKCTAVRAIVDRYGDMKAPGFFRDLVDKANSQIKE